MTILGLLLGLFALLLAGVGLTLLAMHGRSRANILEILAFSYLFGTGVVSLLLWGAGALFSGVALQVIVTSIVAVLGGLGLASARKNKLRVYLPFPQSPIEWLLTIAIMLEIAILFYLSFTCGLGWDGLFNWEVKARYAFLNGGVLPSSYWSDTARDFTHQSYPLWIPFSELWLYLWMGEAHQFWIKILFPLFYVAGAILLATIAARLTASRWIGLLTAALLFFIPGLTNWPGGVQVGYADVPISVVYLGAVGGLLLQSTKIDPVGWRLYAFCLALLPWAKREGTVLWLVAAACGVFVVWRAKHSRRVLLWLLPGLVFMIGWKTFYTAMGKGPGTEFLPMTWTNLVQNWPRVLPIARSLLEEMMLTTRWSIFWPIVALSFGALLVRFRDRRLLILWVATAVPICAYSGTYVFSGWPDWMGHVEASLSRLLLHVMPVAWLAIALALRPPAVSVSSTR